MCVDETQQQRIVDIATLNVRKEESICGERNEERTSRTRPVLDPQGQERSECLCRTRNPSYSATWACDSQGSTSKRILLNPLCASRNRWRYCPITSGVQGAQSPQSRVRTRWLRLQPATWRRWILDETFLSRLGTSYTSAEHKSKAILKTGTTRRPKRRTARLRFQRSRDLPFQNHLDDKQFECPNARDRRCRSPQRHRSLRPSCDDNLAQSDLPKDTSILRTAAQHNRANVGVYASVLRGGKVRRGDSLRVEQAHT